MARTMAAEKLLTTEQKDDILRVTDQRGILRVCRQIPTDLQMRDAHRKYFCKHAHLTAAKYIGVLPQDYQDAVVDYVLRKNSLMDIYFTYNESFFLKCMVRMFSKTRFDRKKFIEEMFYFLSDESTVALIKQAENLTTDAKALKRMKKVKDSYYIATELDEEE